jgi:predicted O-linked N-acetylglucosamine transferase (SPINDLY family)
VTRLAAAAYDHALRDEFFQAIEYFDQLVKIQPRASFFMSYGSALMAVGRSAEATAIYEQALTAPPGLQGYERMMVHENLVFSTDQMDDTTLAQASERRNDFARTYFDPLVAKPRAPYANTLDPERPLRVGYVGGDFSMHSATMAFGVVLINHTPAVEPFLYNTARPNRWDEFTTVYSQRCTLRMIEQGQQMSDDDLAELVRRDRIDILVDLGSFSNGGRLSLFALKPAPIQITAWGYVMGTGLETIDYIFGDPVAMPHRLQPYYREQIYHLPSIIPFNYQHYAPEPNVLPCLHNQPFTFGCFNRAAKIGAKTLALWKQVLHALPESRLILKEGQLGYPYHAERILKALEINPRRVIIQGHSGHADHLGAYGQIDLALDPFPIAGGVSMLEGIGQGVPALIRRDANQERVCSLVGVSASEILGLSDFVADSDEDYVRLAKAWATEGRPLLAQWRMYLRAMLLKSPIHAGYVQAVEGAYRDFWREYCGKAGSAA